MNMKTLQSGSGLILSLLIASGCRLPNSFSGARATAPAISLASEAKLRKSASQLRTGMSVDQVWRILGEPDAKVADDRSVSGAAVPVWVWEYGRLKVVFTNTVP